MEQITLTPATLADLPLILQFIAEAQQHLQDQGIDQWQDGYPNEASIRTDIAHHIAYLAVLRPAEGAEQAAEKIGYLAIDFGGEPAYDNITGGQWHTAKPYAVAHRVTIGDAYKGKGLARAVFARVDALCRARGVESFRIDTHPDNLKMQHLLKQHGFAHCGTVFFAGGLRWAYDKTIAPTL